MIQLKKRPLPRHCISQTSSGHIRLMSDISGIVLHYFSASRKDLAVQGGDEIDYDAAFDMQNCYDLFNDLNLPGPERGLIMPRTSKPDRYYASAHYLVGRDGEIWELAPPPIRVFHAGKSEWKGRRWCNDFMIGVEMVNVYNHPYTEEQYEAVSKLCYEFVREYRFGLNFIAGHEDVCVPDENRKRKTDPGPSWDWDRFRNDMKSVDTENIIT